MVVVEEGFWVMFMIDIVNNICLMYVGIGFVVVFGLNNFLFVFGSVLGGDFVVVIVVGNLVIVKVNIMYLNMMWFIVIEVVVVVVEIGMLDLIV